MGKFKFNNVLDKFCYPWYKDEYPEVDNIVVGHVKSISDIGIFFEILDYSHREAFMPLNQVSRKKIRSVRSVFKTGDVKPVLVTKVDQEKGYIDLSNKYIEMAEDDIQRVNRYATVIQIMMEWMKYVSNKTSESFDKNIHQDLWRRVMSSTVWTQPRSEIYELFKNISIEKMQLQDVFPEFIEEIMGGRDPVIHKDDLPLLEQCIKNLIRSDIHLTIRLKLISLAVGAIQNTKNICRAVMEQLRSDGYVVNLDITSPHYDFTIRDNDKTKMENFASLMETKIPYILDRFQDIEYQFTVQVTS